MNLLIALRRRNTTPAASARGRRAARGVTGACPPAEERSRARAANYLSARLFRRLWVRGACLGWARRRMRFGECGIRGVYVPRTMVDPLIKLSRRGNLERGRHASGRPAWAAINMGFLSMRRFGILECGLSAGMVGARLCFMVRRRTGLKCSCDGIR